MQGMVRLHRRFLHDFEQQVTWLTGHGRDDWAEDLLQGVEEIAARLGRFRAVGPIVQEDARVVLRKVVFRRLPYVAWYGYTKPAGDVWLLRLFGARQDRPDPDPSSWKL